MTEASQAPPRSSLFLSCDLVGSTHFKQKRSGWQKVFLSFYREFTQFVAESNRAIPGGGSTDFHLWKAVGDELIFEVEVRSENEISRAVRVWLQAMFNYEQQSLEGFDLALKGGAFIATFPGPDSESTIPRDPGFEDSDQPVVLLNQEALNASPRDYAKYLYDYFGPSVDTGFRVGSMASRRHFTLSVEVAWAIATAASTAVAHHESTELHTVSDFVLLGSYVLKGVWHGREYPIFAVDREFLDSVHQAISDLDSSVLDSSKIINVCHACRDSAHWPFRLYLPDASNRAFAEPPEDAMAPLVEAETPLDGAESKDESEEGESLEEEPPLAPAAVTLGAVTAFITEFAARTKLSEEPGDT